MRKALPVSLGLAFLLSMGLSAFGADVVKTTKRILEDHKTTFGWRLDSDQESAKEIKLAEGPRGKILQLNYDFGASTWIALNKDIAFTLGPGEGIKFSYSGTGPSVNLMVKLFDSSGNAAGYTLPLGSVTSGWQEVVIPRSSLEFLWGPNPNKLVNWTSLTKYEFTLDCGEREGMSYAIQKNGKGRISFSNIEIVPAEPSAARPTPVNPNAQDAPVLLLKTKGKKQKGGMYMIDDLLSPKGWQSMFDQDGKVTLTTSKDTSTRWKSSPECVKMEYDFGTLGVWVAMFKPFNLDLSALKEFSFLARLQGFPGRLLFKVTDSNKRVFGYVVPQALVSRTLVPVNVKREDLQYLYGGDGEGAIDLSTVTKLEFTIEKQEEKGVHGVLYVKSLMYR